MIKEILDRDFMLRHVDTFGPYLDQEIQRHESGDPDALHRAREAGVTVADLRAARAAVTTAQGDPHASEIRPGQQVFLPPDAATSALQTALQRHLIERRPAMIGSPGELEPGNEAITDLSLAVPVETETLFEKFGPLDIGWVSVGFASLLKLFRGARPFPDGSTLRAGQRADRLHAARPTFDHGVVLELQPLRNHGPAEERLHRRRDRFEALTELPVRSYVLEDVRCAGVRQWIVDVRGSARCSAVFAGGSDDQKVSP